MAAVFRHVRGADPDALHVGVGFSLSANAILLLAAADPANAPDRVLAVHPPIDLERCSQVLSSGGNRVYDRRFVRVLQEWINDAARAERLTPPTVPKGCTLRELDELFTAPAVGFPSRADYYAAASTHERVQDIAAPTHVLSAADDPFVPRQMLESAPWSASTRLFVEWSGGHMGYLAAGRSRRWLDHAVAAHVTALVGDIGNSRIH